MTGWAVGSVFLLMGISIRRWKGVVEGTADEG